MYKFLVAAANENELDSFSEFSAYQNANSFRFFIKKVNTSLSRSRSVALSLTLLAMKKMPIK